MIRMRKTLSQWDLRELNPPIPLTEIWPVCQIEDSDDGGDDDSNRKICLVRQIEDSDEIPAMTQLSLGPIHCQGLVHGHVIVGRPSSPLNSDIRS